MYKFEEQPRYRELHEALHRAVAARIALTRTVGVFDREAAQREHEDALAEYHSLATLIPSTSKWQKKGRQQRKLSTTGEQTTTGSCNVQHRLSR
jgi:hypothetical protein